MSAQGWIKTGMAPCSHVATRARTSSGTRYPRGIPLVLGNRSLQVAAIGRHVAVNQGAMHWVYGKSAGTSSGIPVDASRFVVKVMSREPSGAGGMRSVPIPPITRVDLPNGGNAIQ